MKRQYEGDSAFGTYEEALDAPGVDAVVICTPNSDHHGTALRAIAAGKHVVIEKPLAVTVQEADEIIAEGQREGVHVLVAENHRYLPHVRWLERVLGSGALGIPKLVDIGAMHSHRFAEGEWRSSPSAMGGGALIDGGIHWINSLLTLGGGTASDVAAVESRRTLRGCPREDTIVVTCTLGNGAAGVLRYSWDIRGSLGIRLIAVHGTEGSAYAENRGRLGFVLRGRSIDGVYLPKRDREGFGAMWKDFLRHLAEPTTGEALATGEMGRRDLAFVEAAYRGPDGQREIRLQ